MGILTLIGGANQGFHPFNEGQRGLFWSSKKKVKSNWATLSAPSLFSLSPSPSLTLSVSVRHFRLRDSGKKPDRCQLLHPLTANTLFPGFLSLFLPLPHSLSSMKHDQGRSMSSDNQIPTRTVFSVSEGFDHPRLSLVAAKIRQCRCFSVCGKVTDSQRWIDILQPVLTLALGSNKFLSTSSS